MGLTFVPTPIGNLGDITVRALEVLRTCNLLVAEDTRVARKLLAALELPSKTIWSYREQNANSVTGAILERAADQSVAVTSDAGMPAISDPGRALVTAARAAGITIEVLPGPSAVMAAAVLSGFEIPPLVFAGFVPRGQSELERALKAALARDGATVFFESPHRIVATLEALRTLAADARVFLGRELTKLHEQHLVGIPAAVLDGLERPVRGEIALVIAAHVRPKDGTRAAYASAPSVQSADAELDRVIDAALESRTPIAQIAKTLVREGYGERHALYDRIVRRHKASRLAIATSSATNSPSRNAV